MIKKILTSAFLMALPVALLAASSPEKAPNKPSVKAKANAKPKAKVKPKITASHVAAPAAVAAVAAASHAEATLTPDQLDIARRVYQGNLPCELGAFVSLKEDARSPGYFDVQIKNQKYRMLPVATSTGAVRLEDVKAGAVWLQLANKSMLMNQKLGQRLADACMNPEQALLAEHLIKNPPASPFDAPVEVATK